MPIVRNASSAPNQRPPRNLRARSLIPPRKLGDQFATQNTCQIEFQVEARLIDSELGESVSTASSRIKHARLRFLAFSIAAGHGALVVPRVAPALTPERRLRGCSALVSRPRPPRSGGPAGPRVSCPDRGWRPSVGEVARSGDLATTWASPCDYDKRVFPQSQETFS